MRVVAHDVSVLAGSGFSLVRVDNEIFGSSVRDWNVHKGPFQSGRKSGSSASTQSGVFNFLLDPVGSLSDDFLCFEPIAASFGTFDAPVVLPVKICKNSVLYRG